MSLLIKALDKAQAEKAQSQQSEVKTTKASIAIEKTKKSQGPNQQKKSALADSLSLSPQHDPLTTGSGLQDDDLHTTAAIKDKNAELPESLQQANPNSQPAKQKNDVPEIAPLPPAQSKAQAANVFSSKRIEPKHQTAKIAMMIGLLALALLAVVAYWYQFIFNQPDIVMPPRPAKFEQQRSQSTQTVAPTQVSPPEQPMEPEVIETITIPNSSMETPVESSSTAPESEIKLKVSQLEQSPVKTSVVNDSEPTTGVEETLAANEQVIAVNQTAEMVTLVAPEASASTTPSNIQITQKKTDSGINAILMRAYQAYNAGNDAQAQSDYKVVLQQYGMNVDAMLGLGAIAIRQGRQADAQGWYQKVLHVEPRNDVAKAGLLSLQGQSQQVLSISQIKSMLQASPTDANLQATLGNTFAQQGQWADAQQAYFEAYRLKQSAENAFNLAVSLDQLGKADIALPYYKEALNKIGQSRMIDKASLEARISSIE